MGLQKISVRPGIVTDTTDYSNASGWFDCDHVRFNNGLPEKIKGWEKAHSSQTALEGVCRKMFAWTSLSGTTYLACPTNLRFYVSDGGSFSDISPIRRTITLANNPIETTLGSAEITVNDTLHGAFAGDTVTLASLTTVGGVPADEINAEHTITSISDDGSYTLTLTTVATSSATGGGASGTATYLYQTGEDETSFASGWGSGFVGGASAPLSTHTIVSGVGIATNTATNTTIGGIPYTTITVQLPANHGASIGCWATLEDAAAVGGVLAVYLNRAMEILTVPSASSFTAQIVGTATSTTTGGGSAVLVKVYSLTDIGWGEGADTSVEGFSGLWTVDNYGEDIVACARGLVSSITLGADPFATTNTSTTVTVSHTAHGRTTGEAVIFSGVTATNGITALEMNGSHTITVVNADSYTFVATSAATSTGSGGGSNVLSHRSTIFYWDVDADRLVPLSDLGSAYAKSYLPYAATEVLTSDINRHVIAFGVNPYDTTLDFDKMLIRFSDADDPTLWDAADPENTSGELRCSSGSYIVTAIQTREEIIVWTDTSLYAMTYVGAPYTYGLTLIGASFGIIGPNAKAVAGSTVYWMGPNGFYQYDGAISPIPCPVSDVVFLNLNRDRTQQIYCGSHIGNSEIIWFYPSAGAEENDRYVIYNYEEKLWYFGQTFGNRTAWIDADVFQYPRAMADDGFLYTHEIGWDDGSTSPASAITAYVESSPVEIDNGDRMMIIRRLIPDLNFLDTSLTLSEEPVVKFILKTRNFPGSANGSGVQSDVSRTAGATLRINRFTRQKHPRLRARAFVVRIESDDVGVGWRLGTPRIDAKVDGQK